MTKSDLIQYLYNEISRQDSVFIGMFGVLIAMFAFFQWRISENQLRKVKEETKKEIEKELNEKYKLYAIEELRQGAHINAMLNTSNLLYKSMVVLKSERIESADLTDLINQFSEITQQIRLASEESNEPEILISLAEAILMKLPADNTIDRQLLRVSLINLDSNNLNYESKNKLNKLLEKLN